MRFIKKEGDISTIEFSAKEAAELSMVLNWTMDNRNWMDQAMTSLTMQEIEEIITNWEKIITEALSSDKMKKNFDFVRATREKLKNPE